MVKKIVLDADICPKCKGQGFCDDGGEVLEEAGHEPKHVESYTCSKCGLEWSAYFELLCTNISIK